VVLEATIVIEYLHLHHPGPVKLIPEDPDLALEARMLDRFFANYVMTPQGKFVLDALRPVESRDPHGSRIAPSHDPNVGLGLRTGGKHQGRPLFAAPRHVVQAGTGPLPFGFAFYLDSGRRHVALVENPDLHSPTRCDGPRGLRSDREIRRRLMSECGAGEHHDCGQGDDETQEGAQALQPG